MLNIWPLQLIYYFTVLEDSEDSYTTFAIKS